MKVIEVFFELYYYSLVSNMLLLLVSISFNGLVVFVLVIVRNKGEIYITRVFFFFFDWKVIYLKEYV